ncbi:granulysin [Tupaia chinensis]|uniref:granulysin n=1 Tax=Tupaia chinensis TaxID=246437 RepID=UPI0003C8C641|nr:granulysin [Tupaia chinensis]
MASRTLLFLAAVLLNPSGLAFSGVGPEHHDPATAHWCEGEQLRQDLAQERPQGDLFAQRKELSWGCKPCQKIMQKLEDMVGEQPNEETIAQAASKVCGKMGLLRGICKRIMRTFLRLISRDIMAGKSAQEVCVDLKICKPAGPRRGF